MYNIIHLDRNRISSYHRTIFGWRTYVATGSVRSEKSYEYCKAKYKSSSCTLRGRRYFCIIYRSYHLRQTFQWCVIKFYLCDPKKWPALPDFKSFCKPSATNTWIGSRRSENEPALFSIWMLLITNGDCGLVRDLSVNRLLSIHCFCCGYFQLFGLST